MAAENPVRESPSADNWLVQRLLQAGLICAVLLMATGLGLELASQARVSMPVRMFELAEPGIPIGQRLMALGIVVLAFTPAFRVVILAGLWLRERDWRFFAVAFAVMLTLGLALVVGEG